MKNKEMVFLDVKSLMEINGGSQQSYDEGYRIGDALRKTFIFSKLISWMF